MTTAALIDAGVGERLSLLSEHVRRLVGERRSTDSDPENPYRGLYVSDDEAARQIGRASCRERVSLVV